MMPAASANNQSGTKHLMRITPYRSEKRRGAHHTRGRSQINTSGPRRWLFT